MADLSDVANILVDLAAKAIYPYGIGQPSVAAVDVMIYAGWPVKAQLDTDLLANKAHVSVYPVTGMERNTTRFSNRWQEAFIPEATLTLVVNNNTVTVGGVVSTPQTCMVIANNTGYAYAVQATDTLETIATGLAALIPSAYAMGSMITIPDAHQLSAAASVPGTSVRELKRQERLFLMSVWAPDFTVRSALGSAIDVSFAQTERFLLPDSVYARLQYHHTVETDQLEKSRLYRRDLYYRVEYATTQTATATPITDAYINSLMLNQTSLLNI